MERDFMGLTKVKDEASEEPIDAAPVRSVAMQWSFPNKNSANIHPQMLSFHGSQQEKRPKTGFDSLASNGLVSIITTSDKAFEGSNRKPKHYSMHHPQTNQINGFPSFATSGLNPISDHVPGKAFVGTTGFRSPPNNNNSIAPVAQLTIFYNGSVCAYDNVSPEKAQAIMLLAGNGAPTTMASSSSSALAARPVNSVQTCINTNPSVIEAGLALNHRPHATTAHLWPSPLPVSNFTGQPAGNKNDPDPPSVKLGGEGGGGVLVSPNSSTPASATLFSSDTVPQFRKKSLARFLEKRKDRVVSSSPYGYQKYEDCSTPSETVSIKSLCTNSSGSSSIPLVK